MDPVTIFQVVAAAEQLLEVTIRVAERIKSFLNDAENAPTELRALYSYVELINLATDRIHATANAENTPSTVRDVVLRVLKNCSLEISSLESILDEVLPNCDDGKVRTLWKAGKSLFKDRKILKIKSRLKEYIDALAFYEVSEIRASRMDSTTQHTNAFIVPFVRDKNFIGRSNILERLRDTFGSHNAVAIFGIGGVGKSQIAIEYCYQMLATSPKSTICWIHSSSLSRIEEGFRNIAKTLQLPGWDLPNVNILRFIRDWFECEKSGEWLLVFDNIDNLDCLMAESSNSDIRYQNCSKLGFIPHSSRGKLLFTSRDSSIARSLVGSNGKTVAVSNMCISESVSLFKSHWSENAHTDNSIILPLLDSLCYLPLAITQAVAFMNHYNITPQVYITLLCGSDAESALVEVLEEDLGDERRDAESASAVIRTLSISHEQLRKKSVAAEHLLCLMAMMDRHAIPKELLFDEQEPNAELSFVKNIGKLISLSVVVELDGGLRYQMHRLVQLAVRRRLEYQTHIDFWRQVAISRVHEACPLLNYSDCNRWSKFEELLPHIQETIRHSYSSHQPRLESANLLYFRAQYHKSKGEHHLALMDFTASYEKQKLLLGVENEAMQRILLGKSETYALLGRLKDAENLQREGVTICERQQDFKDSFYSRFVFELASTLTRQGRYSEAWQFAEKVTTITVLQHGEIDERSLRCRQLKAEICGQTGRYEEAESLLQGVISGYRRLFGSTHPLTLTSIAYFAHTLNLQGREDEAKTNLLEVLQARREQLGPKHPDTLAAVLQYTDTMEISGRFAEAEEMLKSNQKLILDGLGPRSSIYAGTMYRLARIQKEQGRLRQAETSAREALSIDLILYGEEHPDTLLSVVELATAIRLQFRGEEAEQLDRPLLKDLTKMYGPDYELTISTSINLAIDLRLQDRSDESIHLFRQSLDSAQRCLGTNFHMTIYALFELSLTLLLFHTHSIEGLTSMKRAYRLQQEGFGKDDPVARRYQHAFEESWTFFARKTFLSLQHSGHVIY